MMVRWPLANSSSGPLVISTCSALLAGGSTCAAAGWNASRLPTVVMIASVRSSLFMDKPPIAVPLERRCKKRGGRARDPQCVYVSLGVSALHPPFIGWPSGLGGLGTGETPQTADAQGGSRGVGVRNSFPWADAGTPGMDRLRKVTRIG